MPGALENGQARRGAAKIAAEVRAGERLAVEICAEAAEKASQAPAIFWELDTHMPAAAELVDRMIDAGREAGPRSAGSGPGPALPLAGVPVAVKDSFDVSGLSSRLGLASPLRRASEDAAAVAQLRASGAVVIGKTAMDQLAFSMRGQAPGMPLLENPVAPGCLPGGSSSGSAAAVAAGIVPIALGSDTAGSVRVPAALCGVVGYRPTYGLIQTTGCAPLAPSVDTVGVIGRAVADCALAAQALGVGVAASQHDELPGRPRVGVMRAWAAKDAGEPVLRCFEQALERISLAGFELVELPGELVAPGFGRVLAAEFAAAWSGRLDYDSLSEEVRAGIETGLKIAPADCLQASQTLQRCARDALKPLESMAAICTPTCPVLAPPLHAEASVATLSRFTRSLAAFGWPSLSLPCGLAEGKPVGLQLAGAPGEDALLLRLAQELEGVLAGSRRNTVEGEHGG